MDEYTQRFCKSVSNVGIQKSQKGQKIVKKVQKYGGGGMPKKVKRSKGQTIGSKGPNEVKISKFLGLDQKRSKNNNPGLAEAEIVVAMYKQIGLSSQSPWTWTEKQARHSLLLWQFVKVIAYLYCDCSFVYILSLLCPKRRTK